MVCGRGVQEQRKAQKSAFSLIWWNCFSPYLLEVILNSNSAFSPRFHSCRGWVLLRQQHGKLSKRGQQHKSPVCSAAQAYTSQCWRVNPHPLPSAQRPSEPWVLLHEQPGELLPKELPSSKRVGHTRTFTVLKAKTQSPFWTWKFPFFSHPTALGCAHIIHKVSCLGNWVLHTFLLSSRKMQWRDNKELCSLSQLCSLSLPTLFCPQASTRLQKSFGRSLPIYCFTLVLIQWIHIPQFKKTSVLFSCFIIF